MTKKKQERIEGEASRLFQALVQERTQRPTLPRSIRVMERERKGGRKGGRKWAEGGVKGHVDGPICLIGVNAGGEQVREIA